MGGKQRQKRHATVQRLNGILVGLVMEGTGAATRARRHVQGGGWGHCRAPENQGHFAACRKLKNCFRFVISKFYPFFHSMKNYFEKIVPPKLRA
jgi:hypothetical protein